MAEKEEDVTGIERCKKRTGHLKWQARFSMVEVVLALVVVIIGIFGVIGSIPVGLRSQKTAMGTSYATDAAEMFLRFSAAEIKRNWNWINIYANEKPGSNEPSFDELSKKTVFIGDNVGIKAPLDLDESQDTNSGFFLLEESTFGHVDFQAVLRVWKDRVINDDLSEHVRLNVEVSWPASVPYGSYERNKKVFSLEVYKTPEIPLADVSYQNCRITKYHGGGFATTIDRVTKNDDDRYLIELNVAYDGCTDPECLAILDYVVEADPAYGDESISGDGTHGASLMATTIADPFDGFKAHFPDGIGGDGVAGSFIITYTLPDFQDQRFAVINGNDALVVEFTVAEFDYVYNCLDDDTTVTDNNDCLDVEYDDMADIEIDGVKRGETKFGCDSIQIRTMDSSDTISSIMFRSRTDMETTLNVGSLDISDSWISVSIPFDALPLKDIRVEINGDWTDSQYPIKSFAYCSQWDDDDPVFPNSEVTLSYTPEVGTFFSTSIGTDNIPVDSDGENLRWSISDGPSWLYWDDAHQEVAGTPTDSGTFTWTLTVSDGCTSMSMDLAITVGCGSDNLYAPVWQNEDFFWTPSSGTIQVNTYFCLGLGTSNEPVDGDGTTTSELTITVCDGPDWLYWNGSQIAGTPVEAGTFTWTLCASDGCHESSTTITFTVNP